MIRKLITNEKLIFFLAITIFIGGLVYGFTAIMIPQNNVNYQKIDHSAPFGSPLGRTLVIMVDGLPQRFAFSDHMPFVSNLCKRSAWGISEVVSAPLSIAGDHAIFAGRVGNLFSIFEDFQGTSTRYDNIFRRVSEQKRKSVILSSHCLRGAYGRYTDLTAFRPTRHLFSEYLQDADYLFKKALRFLRDEAWDVAAVQFVTLDFIGHLKTPLSLSFQNGLQLIDDYIRQLVSLTTESDTVLITSEHGMDDRGFHMDRSPAVMETPFILMGPSVKIGGPHRILQIDLAPTLSLLAGVSPLYDSPALPALDILDLSPEVKSKLLEKFSVLITGEQNGLSSEALYDKRQYILRREVSTTSVVIILMFTLSTMVLLSGSIFIRYKQDDCSTRRIIIYDMVMTALLCFAVYGLHSAGFNSFLNRIPFSANFILSKSFGILIFYPCIAFFGFFLSRLLKSLRNRTRDVLLLLIYCIIVVSIFQSSNPYHPMNWLITIVPLVAWGLTHRLAWIVAFVSLWIGLMIRRLSFYDVYNPIELPDRWVLLSALFIVTWIYHLISVRFKEDDANHVNAAMKYASLLIPAILVTAFSENVFTRGAIIFLCLIPMVLLASKDTKSAPVWLSLWVVFFLLGTSSTINLTTHIAFMPLCVALWSASRNSSPIVRGIIVSLTIWSFYFMPGNSFDLKLLDLGDRFILSSAQTHEIAKTVILVSARYVLPITILIWGLHCTGTGTSMVPAVASAMLPAVCAIGLRLAGMNLEVENIFHWEQLVRLSVLISFMVAITAAYLLAAIVIHMQKSTKLFSFGRFTNSLQFSNVSLLLHLKIFIGKLKLDLP